MRQPWAFLNGRMIPADELTIPAYDAGFDPGYTEPYQEPDPAPYDEPLDVPIDEASSFADPTEGY